MEFVTGVLTGLWDWSNGVLGQIPPSAYFTGAVRFTLALEMAYCGTYVYVAVRQFWHKAQFPPTETNKIPGYVTESTVKGDLEFAAKRGQNYRHVSEYSGTTVRGALTLPTVLTTGSVFLCLLSGSIKALHGILKPTTGPAAHLDPPLTFFFRFVGYMVLVATGIVPCPANPQLSTRDFSIVLGSYQWKDSKWEFFHGLGVTLFCFVPLIALTIEALALRQFSIGRLIPLFVQWFVCVVCFTLISYEKVADKEKWPLPKVMAVRRWTFLFEVSSLFTALLHYTGYEVSELGALLGIKGFTSWSYGLVFESFAMLFALVVFYEAGSVGWGAYNTWCGHVQRPDPSGSGDSVHGVSSGTYETEPSINWPKTELQAYAKRVNAPTTPKMTKAELLAAIQAAEASAPSTPSKAKR